MLMRKWGLVVLDRELINPLTMYEQAISCWIINTMIEVVEAEYAQVEFYCLLVWCRNLGTLLCSISCY